MALMAVSVNAAETLPWEGEVVFDNWSSSLMVDKSVFASAKAGDKIMITAAPVEVADWQWGGQVYLKTLRGGWAMICDNIAATEAKTYSVEITDDEIEIEEEKEDKSKVTVKTTMLSELKEYGLAIQGMASKITKVELTSAKVYDTDAIWEGECAFGNWANGFNIAAEKFAKVAAGDILEFVYTTDATTATYWQFKTNFGGTETTLSSNASDLNEWGCATVQKGSKSYKITLNAEDIAQLKEKGMYVGGYYCVVTKVNLLQEVTWTVAGASAILGTSWGVSDTNNDMTSTDGVTYTLVKENCTLEKGTNYEYKVAKNHAWNTSYPSSNAVLTVEETAIYTVTFTFNTLTNEVSATTEKTGDAEAIEHTYDVRGNFKGDTNWETSYEMTKGSDGIFTVSIADIDAGKYEYKVRQDNAWDVSFPSKNAEVEVKENGSTVTITFNPATSAVNATVTAPTGITAVKAAQQDSVRYNLAGQKVNAGYKGVVIENGKKFVVK